jgi:hypothetical protein
MVGVRAPIKSGMPSVMASFEVLQGHTGGARVPAIQLQQVSTYGLTQL